MSRPFRQRRNYPLSKGEGDKVPEGSATCPHSLGQRRALPGCPHSWDKTLPPPPPTVPPVPGPAATVAPCPVEPGPVGKRKPESWGSDPHFALSALGLLLLAKPTGASEPSSGTGGTVLPAQVQG